MPDPATESSELNNQKSPALPRQVNVGLLSEGRLAKAEIHTLPKPKPLSVLLGPGVIMLATSIGSGEVYFWPGITMKYGFAFLWPALLALSLQYVLNTEFARYTIATGETVITGFARLWAPLAWFFLVCSTLPWLWPGWSTGGAEALSWVLGGRTDVIAAASLLLIGLALTGTRTVYKSVERIQLVLTAFIVVAVVGISLAVVRGPTLSALADGITTVPTAIPDGLPIATLLAALAFCGGGGSINLATSHWVRDKGFGMGARVPKVKSPFTGEKVAVSSQGYFFEATQENLRRWEAWWKLVRQEQSITFLGIGAVGLVLLMMISHSLLSGHPHDIGIGMLWEEGAILASKTVPWASTAFYLMVTAVFFTSELGVLDHVARLSADIIKSNAIGVRRSESPYLSESALYFIVLWTMIVFALGVLFVANITDTPTLLRIAGSLSGIVMFLYSGLAIVLARRLGRDVEAADPRFEKCNPFRVPAWRMGALVLAVLFYGGFSAMLVIDTLKGLIGP